MSLRLQVLGGLQAFHDDVQLGWVPGQRTRSALFVYLALEPDARREQLARLFWPDEESERARHDLSQTLYLLRQALGDESIEQQGDLLRFSPPVESDARQLEAALERGDFAGAAGHYRGTFLRDVILCDSREFEAWVDRERARYGRLHRRARRGQIDDLVARDLDTEAIEAARAWTVLEPFEDEGQHRLIGLLAASGQRAEALRQYELYEKLLASEQLEALDETKALVAQIRAGEVGRTGVMGTSVPAAGAPSGSRAASLSVKPAAEPASLTGPTTHDSLTEIARELSPDLEVLRPLGEGRSGRVFLARETRLQRLVAVKVLAPELAGDRVALGRFEREARAAAALNHPNAVPVYRFGYLGSGVPYLVMQYVKGGTLADKLEAEGPLPVARARQVLSEVADALATAHRSGFVHRDLRPGNVLCDEEGGRVLVSDFGLAGVLPEARDSELRLTNAGEVLGVPEYTSPEQLRGEDASEGSDVYALGVMGYRMLASEGPFGAKKGSTLLAAHLREQPRPLRLLRADVDAKLADLLERCLAKDPLKRPRAAYLAQTLRQEPAASAPAPLPAPPAAPSPTSANGDAVTDLLRRRLPQIVAITIVTGLALLGFVGDLTDRSIIPELVYQLSLCTVGYAVAVAAVVAWFHGKPGRQQVPWAEVVMIALVAAAWLVTCVMLAIH